MHHCLVFVLAFLMVGGPAWADCISLDLTGWTLEQRRFLNHVTSTTLNSSVQVTEADTSAEVCAPGTTSGLQAGTLQTMAQALVVDQANAAAQAAAERVTLEQEQTTNPACNVTSLQDALDKINGQQVAIQADIDAITNIATAKTALTTTNNRLTTIDANIVKCLFVLMKKARLQ